MVFHYFVCNFSVLYIDVGVKNTSSKQKIPKNVAIKANKKNKKTNLVNVIDIQGKNAITEVTLNIIPDSLNEVPLCKMGLTSKYSLYVLSIKRDSRIVEVTKDTMFRKGDIITVFGLINEIK